MQAADAVPLLCIVGGPGRTICFANAALIAALNADPTGRPLLAALPRLAAFGVLGAVERALAGRAARLGTLPLAFADGSSGRFAVTLEPLPNDQALVLLTPIAGANGAATPVAEVDGPNGAGVTEAWALVLQAVGQLRPDGSVPALDAIPCAVLLRDAEGRIVDVNRAAEARVGLSRTEIVDGFGGARRWHLLRPDGTPIPFDEVTTTRARLSGRTEEDRLVKLVREDGGVRWVQCAAAPVFDAGGALRAIISTVVDVTAREQAEAAARRRSAALAALYEATLVLVRREGRETLLQHIVQQGAAITGASGCSVALLAEGGARMELLAAHGTTHLVPGSTVPFGRGVLGRVWASGRSVLVNDYEHWMHRLPRNHAVAFHAAAAVPLLRDGLVIGVLGVAAATPDAPFDGDTLAVLEQLARLAALAVENVRLRQAAAQDLEERRRAERALAARNSYLTALHETTLALLDAHDPDALLQTVLNQITRLFNTPRGYIAVLQADGETMRVVAASDGDTPLVGVALQPGVGAGGHVWQSGETLVVPDYARWPGRLPAFPGSPLPGHIAAVPLLIDGAVAGVLAVNHSEPNPSFDADDLAMLEQFGRLVALALQKARLYAAAQAELEERRRVEAALRTEEQRFHAIFNAAPVGICLLDRDGLGVDANPAMLAHLDRTIEEVRGTPGAAYMLREDRRELADQLRALMQGDLNAVNAETRHLRRDGSVVWSATSTTALRDADGEPTGFVVVASDISERRAAEQALARRNGYLAALHATTLALINRLDLYELLDTLVARAAAVLDTPHGYVYLVDPDGRAMTATTGIGLFSLWQAAPGGERAAKPWEKVQIRRGEGIGGAVWQSGETIVLDDYSTWAGRVRGGERRDQMRATAAVPLRSRGAIVGVLALVYTDASRRFDADAVAVLEQFAQLASLAIDNAALYRAAQSELDERRRAETELRRRNGYLAALQRTTLALIGSDEPAELIDRVLRDATALFGATLSYLALLQDDGATMTVTASVGTSHFTSGRALSYGKGIGGYVWATGEPVFIHDYREWPWRDAAVPTPTARSGAAVPLTEGGHVIGVLVLVHEQAGVPLDDAALTMLEQFGRLASLVLQNARLHAAAAQELRERGRAEEALMRRNGYLAALHETTLALTDQRDLPGTLTTILARVQTLIETEHAFLELVELRDGEEVLLADFATGVFAPAAGTLTRRGEGLDGSVWQDGVPVVVDDYRLWPGRRNGAHYDALQGVAAVPLKLGTRVVGVLGLARLRGERGFSIEEVEALAQFGQLAAVAVENARLHDETRAAQMDLQRQFDFTDAITNNLGEGVIALDRDLRVTRLNPAAAVLLGWSERDLLGAPLWRVIDHAAPRGRRSASSGSVLEQQLREGQPFRMDDALFTRRDGSALPVDYSASPIVSGGDRLGTVIAFHDISERKQQTAALEHQALHDALTALPNRVLLQDRLEQALRAALRSGEPLALLVMDLDGFKEVNDTLGHQAGDTILQQVAQRLNAALRDSDTVARLGGDEFAVLLPGVGAAGALVTARKLLHTIEQTATVDDFAIDVGASIGVALFPEHGDEPEALLRRADVAMYVAKRNRGGVEIYAPEQDKHTPDRLAMLSELRGAIEADQLVLHYQPVVRFADRHVVRAEALLRWQHPRHGLLGPDTFIPLAEDTNLIAPLTQWVLAQALQQCAAWQAAGRAVGVAINLSPRVLHEADLPRQLETLLARHALPAAAVTLEITESALIAYPQRALDVLTQLHGLGLRLAIDDFGTGYSSLAYVKQLPIDEIKIDKSFVIDMHAGESDAAIVRSTIDLAHNLGLQTVAEGIETARSWQQLDALGCDEGQGYYLTRPLPPAAFDAWLTTHG